MAGIWTDKKSKVLNGAYLNFRSLSSTGGFQFGDVGVLAVAMPLTWGAPVTELEMSELISEASDAKIGLSLNDMDNKVLNLIEAFKNVGKVIVVRTDSGGQQAGALLGATVVLTVTAKYAGDSGNKIAVSVTPSDGKHRVSTYFNGNLKDSQIVSSIDDLLDNEYVIFSGTGTPEESSLEYLEGGENGVVDTSDILDTLSSYEFDVLYSTSTIADLLTKVKTQRDAGHHFQVLVPYDSEAPFDYEGIIQLAPQTFTDSNGVDITEQVKFYIAGVLAGAQVSQSATYHVIPFIADSLPAYTVKEMEDLKLAGVMFVKRRFNGDWVIEEDLNSLTTYDADRIKAYSSNRVIRTLKVIHNYIVDKFEGSYIGQGNTEILRDVFKSEVAGLILQLQARGVIENFDAQRDITIRVGSDTTSVEVDLYIQPVGVLSKLYMNVIVTQNR